MARIVFAGLEPRTAGHLASLLAGDGHEVQRAKHNITIKELLSANIVFAGGDPDQYLSVLRRVRAVDPILSFIVVARFAETAEWLDALEAGATDYCVAPFDQGQVRSLMAAALSRRAVAATASNGHQPGC